MIRTRHQKGRRDYFLPQSLPPALLADCDPKQMVPPALPAMPNTCAA